MVLDQHGASQSKQRGRIQEHTDNVGAALDLLVHPLEGVGGPDLPPVLLREPGEGKQVVSRELHHPRGGQHFGTADREPGRPIEL
ncbi:hypothetical protein FHX53_001524 [Yonghaparkia alkaliphila]|uniref:Uncharacterized protein n=1 Tax=Microcella alkalica TaxID=355930 RepID=A0A839EBW0_9MICO|nr:hypothetical protein [Microcella alkalica]